MVLQIAPSDGKIDCPTCGWPIRMVKRAADEKVAARHHVRRVRFASDGETPSVHMTDEICEQSLQPLPVAVA